MALFSAVIAALENMEEGLVISDNSLPDAPMVYVNDGFLRLTGYSYDEVIGRNCRFLQCEETDNAELETLRNAIKSGEKTVVELWNQRQNGERFLNRLSLIPVAEGSAPPRYYIGIQSDITKLRDAQETAARVDTLKLTMRTVNDIVLNAFNGLQTFREMLAQGRTVSDSDIAFFESIIGDATGRLRKIESLEKLERATDRGIETLKYE